MTTARRVTRARANLPIGARAQQRGVIELEWLTDLWWLDAPFEIVQRVHRAASAAVPKRRGGLNGDPALAAAPRLREVSAVFHKMLAANSIYVEGGDNE